MDFHIREFFVSKIRTGKVRISISGDSLFVLPPTIDDNYQINLAYNNSYNESLEEGLITEREMEEWMREKEIWTIEDDLKEKELVTDLEKYRLDAYSNRHDKTLVKTMRNNVMRAKAMSEILHRKKTQHIENTCEGLSLIAKAERFIELCTFSSDNSPYDFRKHSIAQVHQAYNDQLCTEKQVRELARSDPWKSIWTMKEISPLFINGDRDMSVDQKNLVIWSRIYDNVQESIDCPPHDVIDDDLLLDGWFIFQRKKREKDLADRDFDSMTKNEKIKGADEIYIMANSREHAKQIHDMNSDHAKKVKSERGKVVREKGKAYQHDFPDQKLKLSEQSLAATKEHYRRK